MLQLHDALLDPEAESRWKESRQRFAALPQPEHVPNRAAFDEEIARRLAFDERCRDNYELYLKSKQREARPSFLPIRMDVENISRCNFTCGMCQVSLWPGRRRADDMSVETFKSLIDEQYGLVEIKLHGMGEPTLGGDDFVEMTRYARERHIWVRTVTNASLLHVRDHYRKLIDADINEVQISIDGHDEETFAKICGVGNATFRKVANNCRLINDYCKEKGVVRTKMWTVVQKANYEHLPALVDLAAELGFPTIVFSLDLTDFSQQELREKNAQISIGADFNTDMAWAMVEQGQKAGVRVAFWGMAAMYDTASPERLCPWPFERSYIGSDMRVTPCCIIANPDACEIGKGPTNSFSERWNSDEYAAFRQRHLDADIPPECQGCYGAVKSDS
jgi:pyrroloquinoline quinone biosynthesis protein E